MVLVGVIHVPHFGFVLGFGPFAIIRKERAQTASALVLFGSQCGRIETSFFLKVVLHNHGGRSVGRLRVRIHLALFLRALVLSLLRRWSPRPMWDLCLPLAATPTMAVNVDSQPPNPLAACN